MDTDGYLPVRHFSVLHGPAVLAQQISRPHYVCSRPALLDSVLHDLSAGRLPVYDSGGFFCKKAAESICPGLFFLLLCDLCVVLSFLGLEVCRPLIWIFYIPALMLLTYADTSCSCIHDT